MSIEQTLVGILEADEQLTELVDRRIYLGEAPQGETSPHVVFSLTGESWDRLSNLVEATFDIDAYAEHHSVSKQIAERVRIVLNGKSAEGSSLRGAFLNNRDHTVLPPQDGRGRGRHLFTSEFTIWYQG